MRYFLINYFYSENGKKGKVNGTFVGEKFPNQNSLVTEMAKQFLQEDGIDLFKESIIITNIFEFKNKEDFNNFIL